MSEKHYTFGLVGAGRIGKMHAENILMYFPQIKLKTVVDVKLDDAWVKQSGIEVSSTDTAAITDDPEIDAVVITTPSDTHVEMIKLMARAGKHIFCEKPIAFDPDEIFRTVEVVNEAGVKLQVGFNRRFDPDFVKVQQAVKSGKLGKVNIINMINRDPKRPDLQFIPGSGGLFMDFCVHDFDMVRYLTESEIEEIYVKGANLVDPQIGELGDIDTALLTLKLANGAIAIINVCRETNYGYDQQVEVLGSKGSMQAQNLMPTKVKHSTNDGIFMDRPYYSFIERYKEAYIAEIREFIDCVANDGKPTVDGRDAMQAVKAAVAAQRSFSQNKPVSI